MIQLPTAKAYIFDMDGTLIDSMAAHIDAWEAACEAFGYPFDRDFHYSLGGVPSEASGKQPCSVPAARQAADADED